jgi:sec-independent protein translocase protein TatA
MDLFSGPHIILIALVVLLMFGGKKIPELMRGLGKGIREFNDAKNNVKKEIEDHINDSSANNSTVNNNAPVSTPNQQITANSADKVQ